MISAEIVIKQVQEQASEYLEMHENPTELLVGILAGKVVRLQEYIIYLERRLKHDSSKNRIHSN